MNRGRKRLERLFHTGRSLWHGRATCNILRQKEGYRGGLCTSPASSKKEECLLLYFPFCQQKGEVRTKSDERTFLPLESQHPSWKKCTSYTARALYPSSLERRAKFSFWTHGGEKKRRISIKGSSDPLLFWSLLYLTLFAEGGIMKSTTRGGSTTISQQERLMGPMIFIQFIREYPLHHFYRRGKGENY